MEKNTLKTQAGTIDMILRAVWSENGRGYKNPNRLLEHRKEATFALSQKGSSAQYYENAGECLERNITPDSPMVEIMNDMHRRVGGIFIPLTQTLDREEKALWSSLMEESMSNGALEYTHEKKKQVESQLEKIRDELTALLDGTIALRQKKPKELVQLLTGTSLILDTTLLRHLQYLRKETTPQHCFSPAFQFSGSIMQSLLSGLMEHVELTTGSTDHMNDALIELMKMNIQPRYAARNDPVLVEQLTVLHSLRTSIHMAMQDYSDVSSIGELIERTRPLVATNAPAFPRLRHSLKMLLTIGEDTGLDLSWNAKEKNMQIAWITSNLSNDDPPRAWKFDTDATLQSTGTQHLLPVSRAYLHAKGTTPEQMRQLCEGLFGQTFEKIRTCAPDVAEAFTNGLIPECAAHITVDEVTFVIQKDNSDFLTDVLKGPYVMDRDIPSLMKETLTCIHVPVSKNLPPLTAEPSEAEQEKDTDRPAEMTKKLRKEVRKAFRHSMPDFDTLLSILKLLGVHHYKNGKGSHESFVRDSYRSNSTAAMRSGEHINTTQIWEILGNLHIPLEDFLRAVTEYFSKGANGTRSSAE